MAAPELQLNFHLYFGDVAKFTISEAEPVHKRGWSVVTIPFENYFKVRESLLNLGRVVEGLESEALKFSVINFAKQIVDFYQVKINV